MSEEKMDLLSKTQKEINLTQDLPGQPYPTGGLEIGYTRTISSGWMEGPLSHHKLASKSDKESDYFMQWVHPLKLHRVGTRTPLGYRLTYGLADDVWNSQVGVKIHNELELTEEVNKKYTDYMKSRGWFREMKIFTGGFYEQGEASLLLYFDATQDIPERPDFAHFEQPVPKNAEITKVKAVNYVDYKIVLWDDFGEPEMYVVDVHLGFKGTQGIRVHASRMMRYCDYELYQKHTGWAKLHVVYDSILIHAGIVKAAGEAAFRWGTGHPLILTKNVLDDAEIAIIKRAIGTPTRRSWHILPSEYVESFEMKGQAGQMLNLKVLADLALENVIIGTKVPRAVLTGEVQVAAGGVEDRTFYGLLDERQTELEEFVRRYHQRDINIRKIFNKLPDYEIDWGIRHVLSEMDQMEYDQRRYSNALALTTICTVNECRRVAGFPPLAGPEGEMIMGVDQMIAQMQMMTEPVGGGQSDEAIAHGQKNKSTTAMSKTGKDLEKNKTVNKNKLRENKKKVKDSLELLRRDHSVDEIVKNIGWSKSTYYKLENWLDND